MSNFSISFLGLILILVLVVLVPLLIGIYVYRDARARNMDAVLWTLVAVLVPSCIGLIIYLVIRTNNTIQNCPRCRKPVEAEYVLCPHCGMHLKGACPACAAPVDQGWKLCPKCGAQLPTQSPSPASASTSGANPQIKKDRKLMWILIAAIATPVLIFIIVLSGMFLAPAGGPVSATASFNMEINEDEPISGLQGWIDACDTKGKGVYALTLSPEKAKELSSIPTEPEAKDEYHLYLYINYYKGTGEKKSYLGFSEFHNGIWQVEYTSEDHADDTLPDYELSEFCSSGEKVKALRVVVDGDEVAYELEKLS